MTLSSSLEFRTDIQDNYDTDEQNQQRLGLQINTEKTKTMTVEKPETPITIHQHPKRSYRTNRTICLSWNANNHRW